MRPANDNDFVGERRRSARQRVVLKGKLASADVAFSWDCVIRNLSPAGAQIRLLGREIVPTPLFLINVRDALAHEAKVIWTQADQAGVSFTHTHDLRADGGLGLSHHIRQLWRALAPRYCGELA